MFKRLMGLKKIKLPLPNLLLIEYMQKEKKLKSLEKKLI